MLLLTLLSLLSLFLTTAASTTASPQPVETRNDNTLINQLQNIYDGVSFFSLSPITHPTVLTGAAFALATWTMPLTTVITIGLSNIVLASAALIRVHDDKVATLWTRDVGDSNIDSDDDPLVRVNLHYSLPSHFPPPPLSSLY